MKYFILFLISIAFTLNSFAEEKDSTKELTQSILELQKELVKSNSKTQKELVKSIESSGDKIQKSLDLNFSNLNNSVGQKIALEASKIDSISLALEKINNSIKREEWCLWLTKSEFFSAILALATLCVLIWTVITTKRLEEKKVAPFIIFVEPAFFEKDEFKHRKFQVINIGNGPALNINVEEVKPVEESTLSSKEAVKFAEVKGFLLKYRIPWLQNRGKDFPKNLPKDGIFSAGEEEFKNEMRVFINAKITYESIYGKKYASIIENGEATWKKL
ncbi:MAG: hypothetical protein DWQ06_04165 [Calditrichaeota bacterium]|nr:MAG: hypothetical protein DWQ06_04165 [Calditrichota bacterium]